MTIDPRLQTIVQAQPYPLLFATISGAHLYGFPSPDSDYDLRGAHILPLEKFGGLDIQDETIENSRIINELDMDIVSHDLRKFFKMLLKKNGYVLEQLYSPLVVHSTPHHERLKSIATGCITRHHSHHYLGFAETQWNLFLKETPHRIKPLLYVYRVLLTGIHLMRTGRIEANLSVLNEEFQLQTVFDLISQKRTKTEQSPLEDESIKFHHQEYLRLRAELEVAHLASALPEAPDERARESLNEMLVELRSRGIAQGY